MPNSIIIIWVGYTGSFLLPKTAWFAPCMDGMEWSDLRPGPQGAVRVGWTPI